MRCIVLTLFPEMVGAVLGQSMLKRAQDKGLLEIRLENLRDHASDRHKTADDVPYGGGAGMVMKAEPILRAIEAMNQSEQGQINAGLRIILPSPQGRPFTHEYAVNISLEQRPIVFLCGHYEGIDERVTELLNPEEISLGDYVLTGGELAAAVIIDAAARLIPGVLGDSTSTTEESFAEPLLEYPQFTRPAEVRGLAVPDVLLSGNHEAIRLWRRKESLRNTYRKRPDLLRDRALSEEDMRLLNEVVNECITVISAPDAGGGVRV
ncbi:tRNA (guanosine(37)-N1)-methyltransferase TrmD [Nitrospira sp. Nam80]